MHFKDLFDAMVKWLAATQSTATQKSIVNIQVLKHSPNGLQVSWALQS
jgi:hypothetical protein